MALFMVYSLGSPSKCCRHCGAPYSTQKKEWADLQPSVQKIYIVMQSIVIAAFSALIGFVCHFLISAVLPGWGWLAVFLVIVSAWMMGVATRAAIRSSILRTGQYLVMSAENNILPDVFSYYQIAQNVSFGIWAQDTKVCDVITRNQDWFPVTRLLVLCDDLDIVRRVERSKSLSKKSNWLKIHSRAKI